LMGPSVSGIMRTGKGEFQKMFRLFRGGDAQGRGRGEIDQTSILLNSAKALGKMEERRKKRA